MNPASDREDGDAAVPNGGSPQNDKLASGGGDLKTACEDTFRDLCRLAQVGFCYDVWVTTKSLDWLRYGGSEPPPVMILNYG